MVSRPSIETKMSHYEPDEPSLIEAIRALAGLEGVEGGEHDQQEGEEEAGHEAALVIMRSM